MRPSGSQLMALQAIEKLAAADHIAVSQETGDSSAYCQYLLRDLAKYDYVEKAGKVYRLTPAGRSFLEQKRDVQEKVKRLQEGMVDKLHEGLGEMIITQAIENRLKIRAIVELIAESGIVAGEDLKVHLATVTERDWNEEVDSMLPVGLADGFKIKADEQPEAGLGWAVITQTIEDRLKIRAIVELIANKGILPQEELKAHLAAVVQRDWDNEVDKLLPEGLAEMFKMAAAEEAAPTKEVTVPTSPAPSLSARRRAQVERVKVSLTSDSPERQPTRLDKATGGVFSAMEQMREGLKVMKEQQKQRWYENLSGEGETPYNPKR